MVGLIFPSLFRSKSAISIFQSVDGGNPLVETILFLKYLQSYNVFLYILGMFITYLNVSST